MKWKLKNFILTSKVSFCYTFSMHLSVTIILGFSIVYHFGTFVSQFWINTFDTLQFTAVHLKNTLCNSIDTMYDT